MLRPYRCRVAHDSLVRLGGSLARNGIFERLDDDGSLRLTDFQGFLLVVTGSGGHHQ